MGRSPKLRNCRTCPPTVSLTIASPSGSPFWASPRKMRRVRKSPFLSSYSVLTQSAELCFVPTLGLLGCFSHSATIHFPGAPLTSYARKYSKGTRGSRESNDDAGRFLACSIAALSLIVGEGGCAHAQRARAINPRLIIERLMCSLDTGIGWKYCPKASSSNWHLTFSGERRWPADAFAFGGLVYESRNFSIVVQYFRTMNSVFRWPPRDRSFSLAPVMLAKCSTERHGMCGSSLAWNIRIVLRSISFA